MGVRVSDLSLRIGIFGAEPWTEEMRDDIESKFGITALNIYGLSEIMGPGVAMECAEAKEGMHIYEDHFYPEIIDPGTGETLPPGSVGELVITTLTKEGIPLLRYRTRDITALDYSLCRCGRAHARLKRLSGRSDDMIIVRGVNVFPAQIEAILLETDGLAPHYQIVLSREDNLDQMEVRVEVSEDFFSDEIRVLQRRENHLQKVLKEFLGVSAKVRLIEPRSIERSEGKANRVIDNR
jgi:phenylacetate-CoA ligase